MAGIQHADSIIADSTVSTSSPTRATHSEPKDSDILNPVDSEREPQIRLKRVGRTYGRPKPRVGIDDAADDDLGFRARILRTAPRDADDQVIPESDDTIENFPMFRFAWRDKLQAIDDDLDTSKNEKTTHQHEVSPIRIADDCDASDARRKLCKIDETNVASGESMQPEGLFDGSLSSLLSEPAPNSPQSLRNDEARGDMLRQRFMSQERAIDNSRGSDSEDTSPQHSYAINSPKRRSSSTPPTSPLAGSASQETVDHSVPSTEAAKKGNSSKGKGNGKERRIKGLTKKELIEMQKESARLLAGQHVSIERTHARSTHTIASLFNKLKPLPMSSRPDSDPIVPFSSPAIMLRSSHNSSAQEQDEVGERSRDAECEEDMPDVETILREHTEMRVRKDPEYARETKKAGKLEEQKRKALEAVQRTRAGGNIDSDTDDDLEVEVMVGSSQEHETKNFEVLSGAQTAFISSGDKTRITSRPNRVSHKDLQEAAKPAFLFKKGPSRQRGQPPYFSQTELNDLLLQRADRQGDAIEERKKELWVKNGGVLKEYRRPETEEKLVIDWLEKGAARDSATEVDVGEEDGDDPEYEPGDIEGHESEESDVEANEPGPPDNETAFYQRMNALDEDADADKENHRPAPRRRTAQAIVNSDDEDEQVDQSRPQFHTVLVPDTSFEDHSDESSGGDKENSAELAFSFDDNKENEGVPRHLERGRVINADEPHTSETMPILSFPVSHVVGNSKMSREPFSRLDSELELALVPEAVTQRRDGSLDRVLKVLHEEDKDATLAPIGSTSKEDLHRRSSSPSESEIFDEPTLVSPIGFSQLLGRDPSEGPSPGSVLGTGGYSQFFSQSGDNVDSFFATPSKVKELPSQLRHRSAQTEHDNFEFTQPNALLPSIKISESQRREVDAMFGKDQEFKLDEAKRSKRPSQHPASSASDTLHFGSFVPSPMVQTPRSIRRPLETLSLEGRSEDPLLDESPPTHPTRRSRLLRGPRERSSPSLSPPLVPRNAFDVLRDGASKSKRERGAKLDIGKSEYIEVEAEEIDEDNTFGFGGAKRNDDEEGENEDQNMVVENLVDDRDLDDAEQAAGLVLQKHLEHQAADDAALEKLHQDAVDGKLRGKRRDRGIRFEDSSDSDSDEDDIRNINKPPSKKMRLDGDALEACGNDPATAPFYEAYRVGLTDDSLNIGQDDSISIQEEVDDECSEAVDPIKVRRQIIDEKFDQGQRTPSPELDPENASWVDSDDQDMDMDDVRVEDRPLHPRKATSSIHSRLDHVGYRGGFEGKKTGASEERQLKSWASQESRAHIFATGRGGFSRKDSVNASSSRKQGKLAPMKDSTRNEGKVIVKHSSLISHVEKRKGFNS